MKAIIIDDIQDAIDALRVDIEVYTPEITIIGTATSVVSGLKLIREKKPELVFLDIQMEDGDGFDLLDILPEGEQPRVIFTTGSKEHAIKAFRYSAVDYLLKPVDPDLLMEAVEKMSGEMGENASDNEINAVHSDKIALHTQEKIELVRVDEIEYCSASGNYTVFHLVSGKKIMVSKTLKDYEKAFDIYSFLRVHQSYLINPIHMSAFLKEDGGYLLLESGAQIPVSIRKKALVMQVINQYL